jgi:hypothetical protein
MNHDDDEIIEEEVLVVANFSDFDDPRILQQAPKKNSHEKGKIQSSDVENVIRMENVSSSQPKCVLHNMLELTGRHEINLGTTLLFQESNNNSQPVQFYGQSINSIEFKLTSIEHPPKQ